MPQLAYVFIYLPGQSHASVAGRFDWEPATSPPSGEFVYAQSYLARVDAVPLDPIALPLREQVFATTLSSGFFGVIRDAIPDDWGRQVAAQLYGGSFHSDFDYLWMDTADRGGALAFGKTSDTPAQEKPILQWTQLLELPLIEALQKIDREIPLSRIEQEAALAFGAGTSAGGARPKLTVAKDNAVWLAKLNRHNDRFNIVRVECAMLDLAAACGIVVPDHDIAQIHGQDVLLVKRFDRTCRAEGVLRHRMVSACTVFQAEEAFAKYSYAGSYPRLARELSRWTVTAEEDCHELFRRMAFNCLTTATDDHDRNHALVAETVHFRLSPAFDLVPQPGNTRRRYLALAIGEYGALAVRENLLSSCESFRLRRSQANAIIDDVQRTVRQRWREFCNRRGVPQQAQTQLQACFDPEFFESEPV